MLYHIILYYILSYYIIYIKELYIFIVRKFHVDKINICCELTLYNLVYMCHVNNTVVFTCMTFV